MDPRIGVPSSSIGVDSSIPTNFNVGNKIVNNQIKRSYRLSHHQSEHSRCCSFIHDRPLHSGKLHPGYRRVKRATKRGWKATRDTGSPKKRGWARHCMWGLPASEIDPVPIDPRDPNADDTPDNNQAALAANKAKLPLFIPNQSPKQLFATSSPTELLNRSASSVSTASPKSGSQTMSGLRPPSPRTKEIKPPTNTEKEAEMIQRISDICDQYLDDGATDRMIHSLKELGLDIQNATEVVICVLEKIIHQEVDEETSVELLKLVKKLMKEKIINQYNITQAISNTFSSVAYDSDDLHHLEAAVYRLGHALDYCCHNRWISIDDYVVMKGSLEHNAALYQPILAKKSISGGDDKIEHDDYQLSPNEELQNTAGKKENTVPEHQERTDTAELEKGTHEEEVEKKEELVENESSEMDHSSHEETVRKIVLNYFNDAAIDKASDALFNEYEEGRVLTAVMIEEAAQRNDVDRELAIRLLFELTGNTLDVNEVMAGFNDLLMKLEQSDTKIDGDMLSKFIARAVVDEVLPMFFIQHPDIRSHEAAIKCLDQAASLLRQEHAAERLYAIFNAEEYTNDLPNEESQGIIDHAKNVLSRFGAFVNDQLSNAYDTAVGAIIGRDSQTINNDNQNNTQNKQQQQQSPNSPSLQTTDASKQQSGVIKENVNAGSEEEQVPAPSSHHITKKADQENASIGDSDTGRTDKGGKEGKGSKATFHGSDEALLGKASKSAEPINNSGAAEKMK